VVTNLKIEGINDNLIDVHRDVREGNDDIKEVKKDVKALVVCEPRSL